MQACIAEVEHELYKLGVPIVTRHNEVAPSQFEMAPMFEETDLSVDHNQLVMSVLRRVALRHGLQALLHEKPFAGINGSGKHCNWSMAITSDDSGIDGTNLLKPGKTPHQNVRFLVFLAAVLKGCTSTRGCCARALARRATSIASARTRRRRRSSRCSWAQMLTRVIEDIAAGKTSPQNAQQAMIKLGVAKLPEVEKDNTDRNRTSPFAFTGAKFEFRAVGLVAVDRLPGRCCSTRRVAEALGELTRALKAALKKHQVGGRRGARGRSPGVQGDRRRSLRGQQLLGRLGDGGREAQAARTCAARPRRSRSCSRRTRARC